MVGCHRCGGRNREGARFCGSCGGVLGSARAGVRKTVTVLFVDAPERTDHHDLELGARASQEFYALLRSVLERYGGTVERHAGDAVMAVFGVPVAREDDARRAVAAALELRAAVRSLPGQVRVAVGINTGEVLTGDATSLEELAVGDPVVVAARLQQHAGADEVLVGSTTRALLAGEFRLGSPREVALRGRSGTVTVVPVEGLATPGETGPRAPYVGREAERRMVRAALERTVRSGIVQLVTVFGEAGTGKTRLVEEVLQDLPELLVLRGVCRPYGEGSAWSALGEVLAAAAGAPGLAGLAALADTHPELATVLPVLASLFGEGHTPVSPDDLASALGRVISALAVDGPFVVVIEDLHAAAPAMLDLVPAVLRRLESLPVSVVVTARPELLEQRRDWGQQLRHVVGLTLRPLAEEQARRLATLLLPREPAGAEQILAAAGGNPLFLEQLAQAWREGAELAPATAPTVAAVLAARLDRLPVRSRAVLERAALIGGTGQVADLGPLLEDGEIDLDAELALLTARDLLEVREGWYLLDSDLLREVALSGIARDERAGLHQTRGLVLAAQGAAAPAGFHLEQASALLRTSDPERSALLAEQAAARLAAAGLRAMSGDLVAACDLLGRAVALLPVHSSRRLSLLTELARALQLTGDLARAKEVLDEAIDRCGSLGLVETGAHARLALVDLHRSTDPERAYEELPGLLAEVLPSLEAAGDDRGLSLAWQLHASALQYRVQWAAMQEPLERAIRHGQRAGDRGLVELAQSLLVGSMFHGPMPLDQARQRLQELYDQPGASPWHCASVGARLAGTIALQGDPDEARERIAAVRQTFHDLGRELSMLATAFMSGPIELLAGAPDRAVALLSEACEGLQAMGDRAFTSTLAASLAEACWRCDDLTGAAQAAALSRELAGVGDVISQVRWRSVQAKLVARTQPELAVALLAEAVTLVESTDEITSQGDVFADAAEVHLLLGDAAAAASYEQQACERYARKGAPQAAAVLRARLC